VQRYVKAVGLRRVVSFVRRPLERQVSEYRHCKQHGEKEQPPLHDWLRQPGLVRKQIQLLNADNIPVEAFGFIGITERYDESLALLNATYNIAVRSLQLNVRDKREAFDFSEQLADKELTAMNEPERHLYARALAFFEQRVRMAAKCKPFAHGALDGVDSDGVLRGWAWWARGDKRVVVDVSVNGNLQGRVNATLLHSLAQWNAPRRGRVGWAIQLPLGLRAGTTVTAKVAATGQELGQLQLQGAGQRPSA